jgi:hypothetical protein
MSAQKVLALDVSKRCPGWAWFEDGKPTKYGAFPNEKSIQEYGPYPWNYLAAAHDTAAQLLGLVTKLRPGVIVIEETNGSKSRYTQKTLEFCHALLLQLLQVWVVQSGGTVVYLNTSDWRKTLKVQLSTEDKKQNAKLSKAKRKAAATGEKLDRKALGIRGKVNKKHVAVRWANAEYGLTLKHKDNDIADALALGTAYLRGAPHCDGSK